MSLQNNIKIQYLLNNWPKGQVVTSAWLNRMGISRQLTQRYQQSGWVEALGVGAYKRPKEPVEWQGGGSQFATAACLGSTRGWSNGLFGTGKLSLCSFGSRNHFFVYYPQ